MLELPAVQPEVLVAPERRPAGVDPLLLAGEGPLEVGLALEAVGPEVHPVAVRAVDRVADHGDQLHVGQVLGDPAVRRVAPQVERRALAADLVLGRGPEQRVVVAAPPDPLLLGVRVARAGPVRRWRVAAQPVLRLLRRGREDLGVLRQRRVQRGGAGLGRADDDEVGTLRPGHVNQTSSVQLEGNGRTGRSGAGVAAPVRELGGDRVQVRAPDVLRARAAARRPTRSSASRSPR